MKKRIIYISVIVLALFLSGVLPVGYYFVRNKVLAHWGICSPDDEIKVWTFRWLPIPHRSQLAVYLANPGGTIHYPDGYSETLTSNLIVKGSLALIADGTATMNMNGTNQILLTVGGTAADNFTLQSYFPVSDHGNGVNSGFQLTGYTGTSCVICVGNGANSGTRTLNLSISNVDVNLASGGAGAVGISLTNTINFNVANISVMLAGNNQVGIVLDGTGNFTGVGNIFMPIFSGNTGSGQVAIRGQNSVTAVNVIGGNAQLIGASSVCVDANQAEFVGTDFNCNAATSAAYTAEGPLARISGHWRVDSGVTRCCIFASGTNNNDFYCFGCLFAPDGGTTITNSGGVFNQVHSEDSTFSNNLWSWRCGASSKCGLFNMPASSTVLAVDSTGNFTATSGFTIGSNTTIRGQTGTGSNWVTDNAPTIAGVVTVGGIKLSGPAPTCTFMSGGGHHPSCSVSSGSTNTGGTIVATTGTGHANDTGSVILTFANPPYGSNAPACIFDISDAGAEWNVQAVAHVGNPQTTANVEINWSNNANALSTGSAYQITYHCDAK